MLRVVAIRSRGVAINYATQLIVARADKVSPTFLILARVHTETSPCISKNQLSTGEIFCILAVYGIATRRQKLFSITKSLRFYEIF